MKKEILEKYKEFERLKFESEENYFLSNDEKELIKSYKTKNKDEEIFVQAYRYLLKQRIRRLFIQRGR